MMHDSMTIKNLGHFHFINYAERWNNVVAAISSQLCSTAMPFIAIPRNERSTNSTGALGHKILDIKVITTITIRQSGCN